MMGPRRSAVGQEKLFDVVAVGFEHHPRAAVIADLLVGPLDHTVTLAGLRRQHLAAAGYLEALLRARLGLDLGHLALLRRLMPRQKTASCPPRWRSRMSLALD